jgi:hypothetical protein
MPNEENAITVNDRRIKIQDEYPVQSAPDNNQVLMLAMNKGYSPEFIEKMMDLQERHQKELARQAFYADLANFKAEAPPVKKDQFNKFFGSWYTSLGLLLDTYNPVLGKHGLSISFPPREQTETSLRIACRLSHRIGHSEEIALTAPIDQAAIGKQSGQRSRNPIQDIKSTFTYLRSATCEAILGVAGTYGTVDDDGNGASSTQKITDDQAIEIKDALDELYTTDAKKKKFLDIFKVSSVYDIPSGKYEMAAGMIAKVREGSKNG